MQGIASAEQWGSNKPCRPCSLATLIPQTFYLIRLSDPFVLRKHHNVVEKVLRLHPLSSLISHALKHNRADIVEQTAA